MKEWLEKKVNNYMSGEKWNSAKVVNKMPYFGMDKTIYTIEVVKANGRKEHFTAVK